MPTNTLKIKSRRVRSGYYSEATPCYRAAGERSKRKVRTGFYSEVTRDNAFALSMDSHQPQKLRVYALLIKEGKLTRHQISDKLNIPLHVICGRVKDLMNDELVIDTEETITNTETNTPNNLVKAVVQDLRLF